MKKEEVFIWKLDLVVIFVLNLKFYFLLVLNLRRGSRSVYGWEFRGGGG